MVWDKSLNGEICPGHRGLTTIVLHRVTTWPFSDSSQTIQVRLPKARLQASSLDMSTITGMGSF